MQRSVGKDHNVSAVASYRGGWPEDARHDRHFSAEESENQQFSFAENRNWLITSFSINV